MKKHEVIAKLQETGLTGNEAKVYYVLLTNEGLAAGDVAHLAAVDRSLTYTLLNNLSDKGLVTHATKEGKKCFSAANPDNLLNPIEEKAAFIQEFLPQLKSLHKKTNEDQDFQVYEGTKGLISYCKLILDQRNIDSFGGTGRLYELMLTYAPHLARNAMKKIEKGQFKGRLIGTTEWPLHEFNTTLKQETRVLPAASPATTVICEDFVSMHLITDKPFAIVIKNKTIVESYRNYFNFLWGIATPSRPN